MTSPARFCRYELRTTDPDAARAFYAALIDLAHPAVTIGRLPERAAARGAPSHWVGHVEVADVEPVATRIVALGGDRLGPLQHDAAGARVAVLRDPFGSVVALRTPPTPAAPGPSPVAWHQLDTTDRERALAVYAELFAWRPVALLASPGDGAPYQTFTWSDGDGDADDDGDGAATPIGGIIANVRLPDIHPHWWFCFAVRDLDAATDHVRTAGGTLAFPPTAFLDERRLAICEDPQGAAFGLIG